MSTHEFYLFYVSSLHPTGEGCGVNEQWLHGISLPTGVKSQHLFKWTGPLKMWPNIELHVLFCLLFIKGELQILH